MAKRLLLNALVRVLGEFIDITEENLDLSLAVWSGQIVLNNLKLKTESLLKSFNLAIHHGVIHRLEINIPWTALLNSPVKILIDGVYLQIGPHNVDSLGESIKRKRVLDRKLEKLRLAEKYFIESTTSVNVESGGKQSNKGSKNSSYVQQLTTKIIDNLEITLKNVHFRYEDSRSIGNTTISAGLTLSSFVLASCDELWKPSFVARTSDRGSKLHKIAEMKSFGVYWNTSGQALAKVSSDEWIPVMKSLIHSAGENNDFSSKLRYVIFPKNNLSVKMTHNDGFDISVPKFDFLIESTNLHVACDVQQHRQLKYLLEKVYFYNGSRSQTMNSYRPRVRPMFDKVSVKLWWKYAAKLVIKRPRYISIIKRLKLLDIQNANDKTRESVKLDIFARHELAYLEEKIPLHMLIMFRQAAAKEIHAALSKLEASPASTKDSKEAVTSGWWSWANKATSGKAIASSVDVDDDVPINTIIDALEKEAKVDHDNAQPQTSSTLSSFHLHTSATLDLSYNMKPIIRANMSLRASSKITTVGSTTQIDLMDMVVEDKYTSTPPMKNLISIRHKTSLNTLAEEEMSPKSFKTPGMTVAVEYFQGKTTARVNALPFVFTLNKDCVQILLYLWSSSTEVDEDNKDETIVDPNFRSNVESADFEVIFEAHSPKIIIPEACSSDSGCLLFDSGFLEVKGLMGSSGMSWDVSFREVNAAMPLLVKDLYIVDEKRLYLIKPFDIMIQVQSVDKSLANMSTNIVVTPEIRGELDPKKLARLLHIIQVTSATFNDPFDASNLPGDVMSVKELSYADSTAKSCKETIEDLSRVDDETFRTPRASPISMTMLDNEAMISPMKRSLARQSETVDDLSLSFSENLGSKFVAEANKKIDPLEKRLHITLALPRIVLDLAYNIKGGHFVLTLSKFAAIVRNRPYDSFMTFNLDGISIEDSMRSESQRYLAKTPSDCQLINISYINVIDTLSPYYKNHATEVIVNFASLDLNCDVKTISNLKSFLEVILFLRGGNIALLNRPVYVPSFEKGSSLGKSISAALTAASKSIMSEVKMLHNFVADTPKGMKILMTLDKISLDILRSSSSEQAGVLLGNAFSLQISNLRAIIDMKDRLFSDVKLRSFDIFDTRDVSKDYAFRMVFCPVFDSVEASLPREDMDDDMPARAKDLLHIVYKQETLSSTFIDVVVSNTSTFVAIDTILDFSYVLMDNFFAVIALLASPTPSELNALYSSYLSHYNGQLKLPEPPRLVSQKSRLDDEIDFVNAYTMNVSVQVDNPRLIILDDPTSEDSKAIVGKCQIEVHFTRETKSPRTDAQSSVKELHESLHLSVKNLDVSVFQNLLESETSKSILEPFGLEYHVRRRSRNGISMSSHMSFDVDSIFAKVSIRDLTLLQSILMRRLLSSSSSPSTEPTFVDSHPDDYNSEASTISDVSSVNDANHLPASNNFSISVTFGQMSIIAVDDHEGNALPLLHSKFDHSSFFAEGVFPKQILGEGSLIVQTDFYNSQLDAWEPVLEKWKPSVITTFIDGNLSIELRCQHTMQLTLSVAVVEKLLLVHSLISSSQPSLINARDSLVSTIQLQSVAEVTIENELGEGVDVDLHDSISGSFLMTLQGNGGGSSKVFPRKKLAQAKGMKIAHEEWIFANKLPSSVDIKFRGQLNDERKPIHHVPFNISKPRLYNLLPVDGDTSDSGTRKHRTIVLEPIVEEVYENARYDPLSGSWRSPFLLGDPTEWTDASGSMARDPQTIDAISGQWEFVDNWTVDMQGIVGVEIDVNGWEYATTFGSFSIASKRRAHLPMDCVRRRRWTRTRVSKESFINDKARPLHLFWEVNILKTGCREVHIRSGLRVTNSMTFPIDISLSYKSWDESVVYGPIKPNSTFYVPLLRSFATTINFRPSSVHGFDSSIFYSWSELAVPCAIQQYDYRSVKDIACSGVDNQHKQLQTITFRALSKQVSKCLMITCQAYVAVTNCLPCDLKYRVVSADGSKDFGTLLSGDQDKLIHITESSLTKISLKTGLFNWSKAIDISTQGSKSMDAVLVELPNNRNLSSESRGPGGPEDDDVGLILSLFVKIQEDAPVEIVIYSKSVIIDRSGLNVAIWSNVNATMSSTRRTYLLNDDSWNYENNGSSKLQANKSVSDFSSDKDSATDDISFRFNQASADIKATITTKFSGKIYYEDDEKSLRLFINDLSVDSRNDYVVSLLRVGGFVYSDRAFRWTHLPTAFRRDFPISIRTSADDTMSRSKELVRFRLLSPALVFVFVDMKIISSQPHKWLEDGFTKIVEQAIARNFDNGKLVEVNFGIYGKYVDLKESGEEWLVFPGNCSASRGSMYHVVILPDPRKLSLAPLKLREKYTKEVENKSTSEFLQLFRQIGFNGSYDRSMANKAWSEGGHGLALFHADNDIVSIGLLRDKIWSEGINIVNSAGAKGVFNIVDWAAHTDYQMCFQVTQMPGAFFRTSVLTVMSRYIVVNCVDEPLYIAQRGATAGHKNFVINQFSVEPWHKVDSRLGNVLHFRTQSTTWSLGAVDINEVGSSVIFLPSRTVMGIAGETESPFVIHVEVKEALASEPCAVVIVVWKASVAANNASLSIRNDSDVPVTVAQADVDFEASGFNQVSYEIVVPPSQWFPFGWADPDIGSNILIAVGESLRGSNSRRVATVSLLKTGEILRLPDNSGRMGSSGEVLLSIVAHGSGRVLRISRMTKSVDSRVSVVKATPSFTASIHLSSWGLSLILDKPVRREFLSLYVDGLDASLRVSSSQRSMELKIMDLQIDNYSETRIYPVLVRSKKKEVHRSMTMSDDLDGQNEDQILEKSVSEVPLFVLTIVQEFSDYASTGTIRYLAACILPLCVEVDSATLHTFYSDFVSDFKITMSENTSATDRPCVWIDLHNMKLLSPEFRKQKINVYDAQLLSQTSKIYFQKLIIHPMKLYVTVVLTPDHSRPVGQETIQSTFSNIFKSLAAVDRLQLRLRSFEVDDAMETPTSLAYLFVSQLRSDISANIGQLVGSLTFLGSPMGFARKIGRGVKAFFYEPYYGLVQSPQDFIVGIGKGTSSLVSGVVSGAMNSTVAIVGTAAKSISYLSGDSEYIRKRAIKRERARTNRGGLVDGIFDGGESLLSGIASGVTGLVTRPIEEARKNGAYGFVRGIGLGLIGAAVKPVMGFTDGIASIAGGISNTVSDDIVCDNVRPARAFDRSLSDSSDLIIHPLNLDAAFAQDFVFSRAKANGYQDAFLTYIPMMTKGDAVILSEIYVFWRKEKSLWGRTWANISHCVCFASDVGIMLYSGAIKNKPEAFSIPCENRTHALEVYGALARNAHRMGNPGLVISPEFLDQYPLTETKYEDLRKVTRLGKSTNLAGELDGYRFGSANGARLSPISGPESDVLKRGAGILRQGYANLRALDDRIWRFIWEWDCVHAGLHAARCCVLLILNRSDCPIQIGKVQIVYGKNMIMIGSSDTGYVSDSRCIQPDGSVVIFMWAFTPSPIEVGHLKANINTAEFSATIASTQRETSCASHGGLSVGFLEKTVTEWWSKYVILID